MSDWTKGYEKQQRVEFRYPDPNGGEWLAGTVTRVFPGWVTVVLEDGQRVWAMNADAIRVPEAELRSTGEAVASVVDDTGYLFRGKTGPEMRDAVEAEVKKREAERVVAPSVVSPGQRWVFQNSGVEWSPEHDSVVVEVEPDGTTVLALSRPTETAVRRWALAEFLKSHPRLRGPDELIGLASATVAEEPLEVYERVEGHCAAELARLTTWWLKNNPHNSKSVVDVVIEELERAQVERKQAAELRGDILRWGNFNTSGRYDNVPEHVPTSVVFFRVVECAMNDRLRAVDEAAAGASASAPPHEERFRADRLEFIIVRLVERMVSSGAI